jgi:hypothetical protein
MCGSHHEAFFFRIQGTHNQHGYHSDTLSHLVWAWWDYHLFFNRTMTQHTSRLCKGYLTKEGCDGVLHHMTWPPQSPDLKPIEMVWGELDCRVKEKQSTSAQHMWELLQDCWKSIQGDYLIKVVKRMPRVCNFFCSSLNKLFCTIKAKIHCISNKQQ